MFGPGSSRAARAARKSAASSRASIVAAPAAATSVETMGQPAPRCGSVHDLAVLVGVHRFRRHSGVRRKLEVVCRSYALMIRPGSVDSCPVTMMRAGDISCFRSSARRQGVRVRLGPGDRRSTTTHSMPLATRSYRQKCLLDACEGSLALQDSEYCRLRSSCSSAAR